jgi:Lar family restriction alleviation protein
MSLYLKPCPFCGGKAFLIARPGFEGYPVPCWVECLICEARGSLGWLRETVKDNSRINKEIMDKWNTRE